MLLSSTTSLISIISRTLSWTYVATLDEVGGMEGGEARKSVAVAGVGSAHQKV